MNYTYNPHRLRKQVNQHFDTKLPTYQTHLTASKFKSAFSFVDGFIACLKVLGEDPIDAKEMDDLIFKEVVDFLVKDIEDEKRGV